jgi:hypothetical protein
MRGLVLVAVVVAAIAGTCGEYVTAPVAGRGVSVTNTQVNSSWNLSGVLMSFSAVPEGTVTVSRVSGGVTYVLSSSTNVASTMWWVADGLVPVKYGDSVSVSCGLATGTVQVLQGP